MIARHRFVPVLAGALAAQDGRGLRQVFQPAVGAGAQKRLLHGRTRQRRHRRHVVHRVRTGHARLNRAGIEYMPAGIHRVRIRVERRR